LNGRKLILFYFNTSIGYFGRDELDYNKYTITTINWNLKKLNSNIQLAQHQKHIKNKISIMMVWKIKLIVGF